MNRWNAIAINPNSGQYDDFQRDKIISKFFPVIHASAQHMFTFILRQRQQRL
jgi:hypothetical protein